jgi:type VI secretion system secreted protein VgrG
MIFLDQSNRSFRVAFLGDDALTARFVADSFGGSEYLSRDFHFDVELLSEDRTVELKDVQGKMMIIWLQLPGGGERPFSGIVRHFEYVDGTVQGIHRYRAQLVPWLAYAALRSECRVFLNQTRQQQVEDLMQTYSGSGMRARRRASTR